MAKRKTYSKYHVDLSEEGKKKRTVIDRKTGKETTYDSALELQFYIENILNGLDCGEIVDYEIQKKYQLQPSFKHDEQTIRAIDYVADFWVLYADGHEEIFDVKGMLIDPTAKLKRKLMYYKYPDLKYTWVTYTKSTGWIDVDEYQKILRERKKAKKKAAETK